MNNPPDNSANPNRRVRHPLSRYLKKIALPTLIVGVLLIISYLVLLPDKELENEGVDTDTTTRSEFSGN